MAKQKCRIYYCLWMGWKSSGLHAAFMGRSKIGGKEAAADLDRETTAMGVVAELVFADFSDGEIAGLGMVTEVRLLQYQKAFSPMDVTLMGIMTEDSPLQ